MVFQFEHVGLDEGPGGKWSAGRLSLPDLKKNLAKWQTELSGRAWNSLFFCNHDQPRVVSRWGDDSPRSAKCIATALHLMQGTPYVYQGEELGMTNCPFGGIENYRDLETINAYRELTEAGLRQPEELLAVIARKSRDNARTPMQWDAGPNAGFTSGRPWIMVNPNYRTLNAAAQEKDPDSVLNWYRALIRLRRESPWRDAVVYNGFELLDEEDERIFAYLRPGESGTLLVACNFSPEPCRWAPPKRLLEAETRLLLANAGEPRLAESMTLEPWQAAVWVF